MSSANSRSDSVANRWRLDPEGSRETQPTGFDCIAKSSEEAEIIDKGKMQDVRNAGTDFVV